MIVETSDVVVVGGGPAGLIAGREASKLNVDVTVLEEHQEIGVPDHCAGLISVEGLHNIDVPISGRYVENRVRGARFYSPSGITFTVERSRDVACVVNRASLDKFLASEARKLGVEIICGFRASSLKEWNEGIEVSGRNGKVLAKLLVIAEGTSLKMVRNAGLDPLSRNNLLPAIQYDVSGVNVDPDIVEIHLGRKVAPGFFAWVIPLSHESARVGLACRCLTPRTLLERFIKKRFGLRRVIKKTKVRYGLVVSNGPIKRTYKEKILVVGDAAGHVKPLTGGGVVLGGICASIAGRVAGRAITVEDTSETFLSRYERKWKEKLAGEFRITTFMRRVLSRLSDKTLDRLFEAIVKGGIYEDISLRGRMDFQSEVVIRVLRDPRILKVFPSAIRDLVSSTAT